MDGVKLVTAYKKELFEAEAQMLIDSGFEPFGTLVVTRYNEDSGYFNAYYSQLFIKQD